MCKIFSLTATKPQSALKSPRSITSCPKTQQYRCHLPLLHCQDVLSFDVVLPTSVFHIFLTCCNTSYSASSSLVVLVGVVCWGMRTNSFIADNTDTGRQKAGKRCLHRWSSSHFTPCWLVSSRGLTCFGGFKAHDKRLPGESINISRFIIWVLILASERHRVSPESIQTHHSHSCGHMLSLCGCT